MSALEIVALILALVGILAGGFAALRADAQAAGAGVILVGAAVIAILLR